MTAALAKARLEAAGIQRVYVLGKVPDNPGDAAYAVVSVDTGRPVNRRQSGTATLSRQTVVKIFGRSLDAVMDLAARADDAFLDQCLTEFPGQPVSTRDIAGQPYRDPDDRSWIGLLHTYQHNHVE